jgi:hypothetical protein
MMSRWQETRLIHIKEPDHRVGFMDMAALLRGVLLTLCDALRLSVLSKNSNVAAMPSG